MDSDISLSGDSNSSTESSSEESYEEEDILEYVHVGDNSFQLPQTLCEDYNVFKELFSLETWYSLEPHHQEHLKSFLPNFTCNDAAEKENTINMLFGNEPFRFSNPFNDFYNNLQQGNFRPDISKIKEYLTKVKVKQQRQKMKSYFAKLLPEVLICRERLLEANFYAPPEPALSPPMQQLITPDVTNVQSPHTRAKTRYSEAVTVIDKDVGGSVSDNDNELSRHPLPAKIKKLHSHQHSVSSTSAENNVTGTLGASTSTANTTECLKTLLDIHRKRRIIRDDHLELETYDLSLNDIKSRVTIIPGPKRPMFGGSKTETPIQKLRRGVKGDGSKHKSSKTPKKSEPREPVVDKIQGLTMKIEKEDNSSETSSFIDPVSSPKSLKCAEFDMKREMKYSEHVLSSTDFFDKKQDVSDILNSNSPLSASIKIEDLDSIDMMALPVELADDNEFDLDVAMNLESEDPILDDDSFLQGTYPNFMCMVRALFPAQSAHRATKALLRTRCAAALRSPIAPLNSWFSLMNDWNDELDNVLDFLAGERGPHPDDFVPYLQYLTDIRAYQWIGAGRDCDALLGRLYDRWLRSLVPKPHGRTAPLSRSPTTWTVRNPTGSELVEFRAQERRRFSCASRPYTYTQHGYRSVVGPCAKASVNCPNASLLVQDRPKHVTFMALVRDAAARLPNGQGSRQDILILLRMSQYLQPTTDQVLIAALGSTLEKLASAKRDPVMKHDHKMGVWTFLHRHKSEEDWIKNTTRNRTKPTSTVTSQSLAKNTFVPPTTIIPPSTFKVPSSSQLDIDIGSIEEIMDDPSTSDIDVELDDLVGPMSQFSSAQLLMQSNVQIKPPTPQPKPQKSTIIITPAQPQNKPIIHVPKAKMTQSPKTTKIIQTPKQGNTPTTIVLQNIKSPQAKTSAPDKPNQQPTTIIVQAKPNSSQAKTSGQTTTILVHAKTGAVQAKHNYPKVHTSVAHSNTITLVPLNTGGQTNKANVQQVFTQAKLASQTIAVEAKNSFSTNEANETVKVGPVEAKPNITVQRPFQKGNSSPKLDKAIIVSKHDIINPLNSPASIPAAVAAQTPNQLPQYPRTLLLRAPFVHASAATPCQVPQAPNAARRGIVRVISPAGVSNQGKSLISPQALTHDSVMGPPRSRPPMQSSVVITSPSVSTADSVPKTPTSVVNTSPPTVPTPSGGRTIQLTANQMLQLATGTSVQLPSGHMVQLSSLQLPTHTVRLPSGQNIHLNTQAIKTPQSTAVKTPASESPPVKTIAQTNRTQTATSVNITNNPAIQISGQSVQLKLATGQNIQVSTQGMMGASNIHMQSIPQVNKETTTASQANKANLPTVQIGNQTIQINGQTVHLHGGHSIHMPGQPVHLPNIKNTATPVRQATPQAENKANLPIVAKFLTAQGQMIALESVMGGNRPLHLANIRNPSPRAPNSMALSGVRFVTTPANRGARPLLLTSVKPLQNILFQPNVATPNREATPVPPASQQPLVISDIGTRPLATSTQNSQMTTSTSASSPPVIKLQQGNTFNISSPNPSVRNVLVDGQQMKLVGGRHIVARFIRPNQPPQ